MDTATPAFLVVAVCTMYLFSPFYFQSLLLWSLLCVQILGCLLCFCEETGHFRYCIVGTLGATPFLLFVHSLLVCLFNVS